MRLPIDQNLSRNLPDLLAAITTGGSSTLSTSGSPWLATIQ
ncbi:MAG: hypothetical protein QM695_01210 [Micropruina sp.]